MYYQPEETDEPKRPRKRKPGGQIGNTNSTRHGFYSTELTPEEYAQYRKALMAEQLDPELIKLRIKFQTAIAARPGDPRIVRTAARLMSRRIRKLGRLNYKQANEVRKSLIVMLRSYDPDQASSLELPGSDEME